MTLGACVPARLRSALRGAGLAWAVGPFNVRVRCPFDELAQALLLMYGHHPLVADGEPCDFTLEVAAPSVARRWFRPQAQVRFDGQLLFEPLPRAHAYALLEWTMNWWISNNAHQYLLLHAAVVARPEDGRAAILPAPPGSGKSTLCAALVQRGWRLLSDEMALIDLRTGLLHGMARPVSLKNQSLRVIREFEPTVVIGEAAFDTAKGTVAHLRPNAADVRRVAEPARPAWVVFPQYVAGAAPMLTPRPQADAFMDLGRNAFNYALLGRAGFDCLGAVVDGCGHFDFSYSRLDDAIATFERLVTA